MTKKNQRIAIAKACGWTQCGFWGDEIHSTFSGYSPSGTRREIPDYFNDLNAMNEAEKLFTNPHSDRRVRQTYRNWLHKLNRGQVWSASAAQRAEAFLRTLYLWEE